jgi:hypothetical protein
MAAAAKVLGEKGTVLEDIFESARQAFFSAGDASASAALPKARETVFAKEVPTEAGTAAGREAAGAPESAAAESIAARTSAAEVQKEAKVLVHA